MHYGASHRTTALLTAPPRCSPHHRAAHRTTALPQIADERFLVFMNDLLSSGNIPGLFPVEDQDDIINAVRPLVKRAGLADTRDNCWDMFINAVRDNLHVILCFSPIGDPIKIRTRRFPALVNCVVIDWFQPWPEEALTSVSKRFLSDVDLGACPPPTPRMRKPAPACASLPPH